MSEKFDFASELARTLTVENFEMRSEWRAHVRQLFADVDGAVLMRCAHDYRSNLYAALVKGEPSSMYAIALHPDLTRGPCRMIDFGILRDPEWFGDPAAEVGGLVLWCSEGFAHRFNELIGRYGIANGATFSLSGGIAIDLQGRISNDGLCNLARLVVVELIAAFDLTGQERAQQDRIVLAKLIATDFRSVKKPPL